MRTRASGNSCSIAAVASTPLTPGSRTSMMTRLGRCRRYAASAISLLAASATTSMSGSTFREADSPMRTMKWSSTTRMRMGFGLAIGNGLMFGLNFDRNMRSTARPAIDLQLGTNGLGTLPHVEHSKVPRGVRLLWTEALAVVAHSQYHFVCGVLQFDLNLGGMAVLDGISDSFLADTQEAHFDLAGQTDWYSADVDLDSGVAAGLKGRDNSAQRRRQIALFQQIASQIPHRTPSLDHAMTAHFARRVERSKCNGWGLAETIYRQIQLQSNAG